MVFKDCMNLGWVDDDARDLIKQLLNRDPKKRLGYGPNGSSNVRRHKFFKNIRWADLEAKNLPSPFTPKMKGDHHSVEMFNKIWTDEVRMLLSIGFNNITIISWSEMRVHHYLSLFSWFHPQIQGAQQACKVNEVCFGMLTKVRALQIMLCS